MSLAAHPSRRAGALMSRAINIDATVDHVIATAAGLDVLVSAIEPLLPSGTRVVFVNADGAAQVARAYGARVLTGAITRQHWAQRRIG